MNPYEGMSLEQAAAAMDDQGVTNGVLMESGLSSEGDFIAGQEAPSNIAETIRNDSGVQTIEIEPGNPASRTSIEAALTAGFITKEQLQATPQEPANDAPEGDGEGIPNEALGPQDLDELLGEENTETVEALVDALGEDTATEVIGQAIMAGGEIDVEAVRDAMDGADDTLVEDVINDLADFIDDGRDYLSEQITAAGYDLNMLEQVVTNDPELYAMAQAAFGQFLSDGSMAGVKAVLDKATS